MLCYNLIENHLESVLGCLGRVFFKFQLEFNWKAIRICSGRPYYYWASIDDQHYFRHTILLTYWFRIINYSWILFSYIWKHKISLGGGRIPVPCNAFCVYTCLQFIIQLWCCFIACWHQVCLSNENIMNVGCARQQESGPRNCCRGSEWWFLTMRHRDNYGLIMICIAARRLRGSWACTYKQLR